MAISLLDWLQSKITITLSGLGTWWAIAHAGFPVGPMYVPIMSLKNRVDGHQCFNLFLHNKKKEKEEVIESAIFYLLEHWR
ncbi:hypothetical protein FRX31_012724 [Thalictrum thalictroides]|uniref:Uncharacterized protein n=1 Tax=Thalictrum thalictroides TaxID=46969 RepID=A0A7J6WM59_THATH|nr:hypothetical protein FRX31_012724 [Thalictrum thalictroides]